MGFNGSEFRENLAAITGQTMQLAFPGMRDAFRAIEEAAVEAIHVRAKEQELEDLFKGMRGEGGVLLGGRQRRNGSSEYAELDALSSRNDVLDDIILQNAVLSLDEQIAVWQERVVELETQLEQLEADISDLEKLEELIAQRQLDPSNPEHRALMEEHDIDPDQPPEELAWDVRDKLTAKKSSHNSLSTELAELQSLILNAEGVRQDLNSGRALERNADGTFSNLVVQRAFERTEDEVGTYNADNRDHQERFGDNIVLEATYLRREEIALSDDNDMSIVEVALAGTQDPKEVYKERYEQAQTIEDEQARLAAEKAIFDEINAEGMTFAFAAANDETLRPLFEPDHFENLEEVQVAANSTLESALTAQV